MAAHNKRATIFIVPNRHEDSRQEALEASQSIADLVNTADEQTLVKMPTTFPPLPLDAPSR